MSTWDGNNYYYSGQGVVLLGARNASGEPDGLTAVGNVSNLVISIETSVLEHKESQTGQRAIDLRLTTETKCKLSMTIENFSSQNLADALRGTRTAVAGSTVSDVVYKARLGKVISFPHTNISSLVVEDGATPLTLGTDYTANLSAGSILLAETITGVVEGDDLNVSYTYAAQKKVDALTSAAQELYMRFEGLNTADSNNPVVIDVFKFSTDPLKELSLISDSVQQFVLEGNVLADPLHTSGSKFFRANLLR